MWITATLIILSSMLIGAEQFYYLTSLGPTDLYNFDGLGSQSVFHWTNNHPHSYFLVKLSVERSESGQGLDVICPDTKVHVISRDDAIPMPNPYKSQSPSTTFNQSYGVVYSDDFVFPSDNNSTERVFIVNVTSHQGSSHVFLSVFLSRDEDDSIALSGLNKGCTYKATIVVFRNTTSSMTWSDDDVVDNLIELKREKLNLFDIHYITLKEYHTLKRNADLKFHWNVYPLTDSGGSLSFRISVRENTTRVVSMGGCVSRNHLSVRSCDGGYPIKLHGSNNVTNEWYLPYPQSGDWFLQLYLDGGEVDTIDMIIDIRLTDCVESCHESDGQGSCQMYRSDELLFASCVCKAGWQGIACTDASKALTHSEQVVRTFMLVSSNIMFIPCVILAIYRKFYSDSLIYLFVFFASSFYHACDQPGFVAFCLFRYDTLQYLDFFGAILAIWFTLVSMTRIESPRLESWLHVLGCVSISTLVAHDRLNLWTFIVPAVIGAALVFASLALHTHGTFCIPKKIMLYSIIPGGISLVIGVCMYAFVETKENYYIAHSMWHISIATAVLFLMPWKSPNYDLVVNYSELENVLVIDGPPIGSGTDAVNQPEQADHNVQSNPPSSVQSDRLMFN